MVNTAINPNGKYERLENKSIPSLIKDERLWNVAESIRKTTAITDLLPPIDAGTKEVQTAVSTTQPEVDTVIDPTFAAPEPTITNTANSINDAQKRLDQFFDNQK